MKRKRNWNYFMKRKQMELLFLQQLAGMGTEKEACTKFFFINLEKRKQVKKHIRKLVISGAITIDPYTNCTVVGLNLKQYPLTSMSLMIQSDCWRRSLQF